MKRFLKPLRVVAAIFLFLCVNAAFLMPVVANALCLESSPDLSWAARIQFLPALFALNLGVVATLLVVTALFGRIYCSTVCPFGILQDFVIRLRKLVFRCGPDATLQKVDLVRLVLLGVLALLAVCGGGMVLVSAVDPYSAFGRLVTNLVRPVLQWGLNLGADWSDAHEKYWLMSDEVVVPTLFALVVSSVTLVVITILAAWKGRWFCNRLCPTGACLALASKRPLVRIRIAADRCISCGLCARGCKAGAIDAQAKTVDNARCVRCFNCLGTCRKEAIRL